MVANEVQADAALESALAALFQTGAADNSALKKLVDSLDDPLTRGGACLLLHTLANRLQTKAAGNLLLKVVELPNQAQPIRLILSPAIFSPELWGQTFAEGLMKSADLFYGKKIVELGTGSGWISLLLLLHTGAKEILALDINPLAILTARLNAWLNGTRPDGTLILSQFGVPLVESVKFAESDLLGYALRAGEKFDHVIGCIPQVLHPDHAATANGAKGSDQELYDLSNYCFQQGVLEDRFGLPLIARALEESQLCLNLDGKVTLVLGGRPGPAAIESMFRRRGFESTLIWSRRIKQADDTDLASLVALERAHDIDFHFFMSPDSQEAISAKTAVGLLAHNQQIFHDLLVYQAVTRCEKPTFEFLRNLFLLDLWSLRGELDFSRITEEQISFLARLSSVLLKRKTLPYTHERSDLSLRDRLAKFLRLYCHYRINPEEFFIGPERKQLVSMILHMVASANQSVVMSQSLCCVYGDAVEKANLHLVQGNDDLSELLQLADIIKPKILFISPKQLSFPSSITLQALRDHAFANPDRWYIVDDSQNFDISSNLSSNMNLRMAGHSTLPGNLMLLYGLIRNSVCPDLELSFLINAPKEWISAFDIGSELTYSRISFPTQLFYEWLFDDLLSFPFPYRDSDAELIAANNVETDFSATFTTAASDPVFDKKPINPDGAGVIRLDYGEFEHSVPDALVKGLFKGFLESNSDGLDQLILTRIAAYLRATRQVNVNVNRIAVGQGVFPLLGAIVTVLKDRLQRAPIVAVPDGSYGPIYATVAYHGGVVQAIHTEPGRAFVMEPGMIRTLDAKPDLLWITQPNNPSGLFYHSDDLQSLLRACAEQEIYLLADEIFFLLSDYRLGSWTPKYLSFASMIESEFGKRIFLLDGVAKSFAAGGLRAGFAVCPDETWARQLRSFLCPPSRVTLRAWDSLYCAFLDVPPHQFFDLKSEKQNLQNYLDVARRQLSGQRDRVLTLLKRYQLDDGIDSPFRGGLFVLAKLGEDHVDLAKQCALIINPPAWGRTPGWSRICFSLTPERFEAAMARMEGFLKSKYGSLRAVHSELTGT